MKRLLFNLLAFTLLFSSCKKEQDPYLISKTQIGLLTDTTQIKNIKSAFLNDSVVDFKENQTFKIYSNSIEILDHSGEKLLLLTPSNASDSTATIKNIRILDPRFKTEKGISTASTFKEIQDAYKISKIDNLINSIVVSVDEINAAFSIDKTELPSNLRFDMNLNIEASQIPDTAKVKYFFINWNN